MIKSRSESRERSSLYNCHIEGPNWNVATVSVSVVCPRVNLVIFNYLIARRIYLRFYDFYILLVLLLRHLRHESPLHFNAGAFEGLIWSYARGESESYERE